MPKGKGVMTQYRSGHNSLVYPGCKYADNSRGHSSTKEVYCLKSSADPLADPFCSSLNEQGKCPLDLEERIKRQKDTCVMGFCQFPGGAHQCIVEKGNKYKTCGECPSFISNDEKRVQEFYLDNPEFLEVV